MSDAGHVFVDGRTVAPGLCGDPRAMVLTTTSTATPEQPVLRRVVTDGTVLAARGGTTVVAQADSCALTRTVELRTAGRVRRLLGVPIGSAGPVVAIGAREIAVLTDHRLRRFVRPRPR